MPRLRRSGRATGSSARSPSSAISKSGHGEIARRNLPSFPITRTSTRRPAAPERNVYRRLGLLRELEGSERCGDEHQACRFHPTRSPIPHPRSRSPIPDSILDPRSLLLVIRSCLGRRQRTGHVAAAGADVEAGPLRSSARCAAHCRRAGCSPANTPARNTCWCRSRRRPARGRSRRGSAASCAARFRRQDVQRLVVRVPEAPRGQPPHARTSAPAPTPPRARAPRASIA